MGKYAMRVIDMKSVLLGLVVILATGCAVSHPDRMYDHLGVNIFVVEEIQGDPTILSYSDCVANICDIFVRKDVYPHCLTHELRHGFEYDWHPEEPNTRGCKVDN